MVLSMSRPDADVAYLHEASLAAHQGRVGDGDTRPIYRLVDTRLKLRWRVWGVVLECVHLVTKL